MNQLFLVENLNIIIYGSMAAIAVFSLINLKSPISTACANAISSIGIIGTFVGIYAGLQNFNLADINNGIVQLLEGLKTAFGTSIAGLCISSFLKLLKSMVDQKRMKANTDKNKYSPEVFVKLLESIEKTNIDGFKLLEKSIVSDLGSSLNKQLSLIHASIESSRFDFQNKFDRFVEKMAENNSKSLIVALEAVMRDFNTKINEQFGDNFKELNHAVKNILIWQENYKTYVDSQCIQLNKIFEEISKCTNDINETEASLAKIVQSASVFSDCAQNLELSVNTLKAQEKNITAQILVFAEVKEKAINAIPAISTLFTDLTETFTQNIKLQSEHYSKATIQQNENQKEIAIKLNKSIESTTNKLASGFYLILEEMNEKANQSLLSFQTGNIMIQKNIQEVINEFNVSSKHQINLMNEEVLEYKNAKSQTYRIIEEQSSELTRQLSMSLEKQIKEVNAHQANGLKLFERSLHDSLNKTLESLGSNLASTSKKFSDDYIPLADKLNNVLDIARRTRH